MIKPGCDKLGITSRSCNIENFSSLSSFESGTDGHGGHWRPPRKQQLV
jgi:hypothetical protein